MLFIDINVEDKSLVMFPEALSITTQTRTDELTPSVTLKAGLCIRSTTSVIGEKIKAFINFKIQISILLTINEIILYCHCSGCHSK